MGERLKQGQLSLWFERALKGNEGARDRIHRYILPRLSSSHYLQDSPDHTEEIIEETIPIIDSSLLPLYQLYLRRKRRLSNMLIEHSISFIHQVMSQRERRQFRNQVNNFIPDYETRIAFILPDLSDSQLEVIDLMLYANRNISQIAEELEISRVAASQRLHRGRLIIEPNLMDPYGIRRVTQLGDKKLQYAAYEGYLESFKFLDLYYSDNLAVSRYNSPNHGSLHTPWKRLWRAERTKSGI